jgi:solute carrier family 25 folate transporter 32
MVLRKASKNNLNGTEVVLLGAAASMAATLISHPIDTVRTTLAVQDFGTQMGILESTRTILKDKGLSGVYRGIMPNMVGYINDQLNIL